MRRWIFCWILLAATLICASSRAQAESALYNTPVYDPVSHRYFALIDASNQVSKGYAGRRWWQAVEEAKSRTYKGLSGRLAIVDSLEVHEFLLRTFRPNKTTWIGIRYWCKGRYLQDATGKRLGPGAFQAWAANWRLDVFACKGGTVPFEKEYMPIAYTRAAQGFQWVGFGFNKEEDAYFIEWPESGP